jgi:hypothetical protein
MTEHQILFKAPMVRALLDGKKTQTRRVVKARADKDMGPRCVMQPHEIAGEVNGGSYLNSPYWEPGDRLWVREVWRTVAEADALPPRDLTPAHRLWFEADAPHQLGFGKLRPSMFMPRWASRITLEVTEVRVERLQDISTADAWAEGMPDAPPPGVYIDRMDEFVRWSDGVMRENPKQAYRTLWESINGAGSWGANPWVWVVAFKRIT